MHMCTPMCSLHVDYNTKSALMGLHLRCVCVCVFVHVCVCVYAVLDIISTNSS